MTTVQPIDLNIGHPGPARHTVNAPTLLFALFGAPVGWLAQLLFAFASTSYACWFGNNVHPPRWIGPVIVPLNVLALGVAAASFVVAVKLIRTTMHEHRDQSGSLLDAGEGRTRFLAVWAACTSLVFLVATGANTLSLHLVTLCRS
jgi:hypothetical protein